MIDREKVIKCLEACTGDSGDCAGHTCPYWDFDGDIGCRTQMELDALALLKEQKKEIENLKEIIKEADYTLEIVKDKLNDLLKKTEGR